MTDPPSGTADSDLDPPALRIFIADDNAMIRRLATVSLSRLGHSPEAFADGQALCDALALAPCHLILMDVHMPVMDGHTATRKIRAELPAARQPYIVAMTANTSEEDRDACTASGMDSAVDKPFRLKDLAATIDAYREWALAHPDRGRASD